MLIRDLKKLINEPHNPDQSLIHAQHDPDLWLFHERRMLIHDLEITTLHLFAVGHRRQEVVQDGDEEVHDEDDHGQQVDHQKQTGRFSAVRYQSVQTELAQHSFHLKTTIAKHTS